MELTTAALFVTSLVSVGLVALWAAASSSHWFLRTSIVLFALSLLLLVPAYEPLLIFALQAATIVTGVKLWQRFAATNRDHGVLHFSLKSLLLLTPIVAVVTAAGAHIAASIEPQNSQSWTTIVLDGLAGGAAVLLAVWITATSRKRLVLPIAAVLCLGLAASLAWFDWLFPTLTLFADAEWPPDARNIASALGSSQVHPQLAWLVVLPAVLLITLIVINFSLAAFTPLVESRAGRKPNRCSWGFAKSAVALLVVLVVAFPTYCLWRLLDPPTAPSVATPVPNGFDLWVAASREFDSSPILTTRTPPVSTAQLAAEVSKFASSYDKVRLGLSQQIRVRRWPDDADRWAPFKWAGDPAERVVRAVARPLMMEAQLARELARHADAARISCDILRLGAATSRDGNLVDYLVCIGLGSVACDSLYPSIAHLSPDDCRTMIDALSAFDRDREPLEQALDRDRAWSQLALNWHGRLESILEDIAPRPDRIAAVQEALRRNQAVRRLVLIELAIRAYRVEHQALPDSLADLIPSLSEETLIDPFDPADQQLHYVRSGDRYLLYSIGNDGQDNHGHATKPTAGFSHDDQDLRLDVYFAPSILAGANATSSGGPGNKSAETSSTGEPDKTQALDRN